MRGQTMQEKLNGEIFNIGGGQNQSFSLRELTEACEKITGNRIKIMPIKENRPGDINIYLTDYNKARNMLNWSPRIDLETTLMEIFQWVKEHKYSLIPVFDR